MLRQGPWASISDRAAMATDLPTPESRSFASFTLESFGMSKKPCPEDTWISQNKYLGETISADSCGGTRH